MRISMFLVFSLLAAVVAHAQLPPPVAREVDFARDVHPIMAEHCFKCHAGDRGKGGLLVTTRDLLLQGGESGPAALEGNSAESLLIQLVATDDASNRMPPDGRALTAEEVGILRAWIDQGLSWHESAPGVPPDASPLHLREVAVPTVDTGTIHPLDKFMAQYLADHGLEEPALVDDAAFARRASLDLVGLLPSLDELQAYESSIAPDKRAQLVDRLLANDRAYAEHWMTFWNDHLRNDFVGTGYIDGGRKAITNWLYASLESNKRYDQFVRELIAPSEDSEGFIKGIVWRGSTVVVQLPAMQAAASTSQVFLGVNLKCASCHDSFVDNWKLSDAFGLANVFSEEPMELVRCDVPQGKMAEYSFLWPELGDIDGALPREERMARVAELVTMRENGPFARAIVNRLWAVTMGRGIIEPLDNIQMKPWYPEMLDWLATDFIDNGHDLKHTLRLIATSRAYQWGVYPYSQEEEQDRNFVFRGPAVRKMSAEQFADAVATITGVWQQQPRFQFATDPAQDQVRAWRVPSDAMTRALGRPNREQVTTRRETISTTLQALELTNGETLARTLSQASVQWPQALAGTEALVGRMYRQALQRPPTPEEQALAIEILGDPVSREGMEDLLWSITMLPEFQLIH